MKAELRGRIERASGLRIREVRRIAGGDAAEAWRLDFEDGVTGFIKTVAAGQPFRMEALGLQKLTCVEGMRVPKVLATDENFLLLEWMNFSPPSVDFQTQMGEALARTHLNCRGKRYGFEADHFIGVTPQQNLPWIEATPGAWAGFWWHHRLEPMLRRLGNLELMRMGDALSGKLVTLLPDPLGPPSLLHGDLWSGNVAADGDGNPVMFDPAPYYGHPEAELGMTRMFGGFKKDFYRTYHQTLPLEPGWEERLNLYMLYHVLNHACIFSGGYTRQAIEIIKRYI